MTVEWCDCFAFELDPDQLGDECYCYCGHVLDEHDETGQCQATMEIR